jgi:hypothetical protein
MGGVSGILRFRSPNFFVAFAKNAESPSDLERSKSVHKGRFQDFHLLLTFSPHAFTHPLACLGCRLAASSLT